MVLFGDSHAMQYFPALEVLAEREHWRLVALTKRECPPGEVEVRSQIDAREYSQCDIWRQNSLKRIEAEDPGTTVVLSGDAEYTPYEGGTQLRGAAASKALESGYVATLERLDRAGMHPIVIRDNPASEHDVPSCVSENLDHLETCAFRWVRDRNKEFDVRAAKATGTFLVDVTPEVCPDHLCRAVTGRRARLPRQSPPHRHLRPHALALDRTGAEGSRGRVGREPATRPARG